MKLRLRLKNISADPVRILDIRGGRRPDLQAAYYPIGILHKGSFVPPRSGIDTSYPGDIDVDDYLTLGAGQVQTIDLQPRGFDFEKLGPGRYEAVILFQTPFRDTRCASRRVGFEIR